MLCGVEVGVFFGLHDLCRANSQQFPVLKCPVELPAARNLQCNTCSGVRVLLFNVLCVVCDVNADQAQCSASSAIRFATDEFHLVPWVSSPSGF